MDRPIIITGFMAAGKTSVAQALGRMLNRRTIDLDEVITSQEKRTPKQIIDEDGEANFREIETGCLQAALLLDPKQVMALGGGAWTLKRNRDLIAEHEGFTVWLDAPFNLCWQRIADGIGDRPLAPNHAQAQKLFEKRRPIYALASFRVNADYTTDVEGIAKIIAESLS
jgi:shikimate kinase